MLQDNESIEAELVLYSNPKALAEFMAKPMPVIAEALTGAIMTDGAQLLGAAGRVLQGALKGKGVQQLGKEFQILRNKGAIKEDYSESRYGFQSLAELLRFIDSEVPDSERLRAVKAMFFSIISTNANAGSEVLNYKLFLLSMKLNSTQVAILSALYKMYMEASPPEHALENSSATAWLAAVADIMGDGVRSLVEAEENFLEEHKLIAPRKHQDRSGVEERNCRLTDLGLRFCQHLSKFEAQLA